jgi:hypothetical protein
MHGADMIFIFDEPDDIEDDVDELIIDEHAQLSSQRFLDHGSYRNLPIKWEEHAHDLFKMKDNAFLREYCAYHTYFHAFWSSLMTCPKIRASSDGSFEIHWWIW